MVPDWSGPAPPDGCYVTTRGPYAPRTVEKVLAKSSEQPRLTYFEPLHLAAFSVPKSKTRRYQLEAEIC